MYEDDHLEAAYEERYEIDHEDELVDDLPGMWEGSDLEGGWADAEDSE